MRLDRAVIVGTPERGSVLLCRHLRSGILTKVAFSASSIPAAGRDGRPATAQAKAAAAVMAARMGIMSRYQSYSSGKGFMLLQEIEQEQSKRALRTLNFGVGKEIGL